MPSLRLRRCLPVLVLLAGLVLPLSPAHAFPHPVVAPHHSAKGPSSSVWAWLAHLFHATWEKNGMTIDPNGQPTATAPPGPPGDNGSMPDPDGLLTHGDNGSMPDPNG
ncbi:MAG: hypothetical protein JF614_24820 [Acidobacteria bacterium]|nr:hypothetical protein [Acidobacteriota bacterium]